MGMGVGPSKSDVVRASATAAATSKNSMSKFGATVSSTQLRAVEPTPIFDAAQRRAD